MTKKKEDSMGDLARLESALPASPYDAIVAVSPENVRYTGDVYIDTQRRIRDRLAFIVWPKHHAPVFLVCEMEAAYVRAGAASVVVDSVGTLFDFESRNIVGNNLTDVSGSGRQFLAVVSESKQTSAPIILVVNWDEEMKTK